MKRSGKQWIHHENHEKSTFHPATEDGNGHIKIPIHERDGEHFQNIRQHGREPVRERAHDRAEAPAEGLSRIASWALSSLVQSNQQPIALSELLFNWISNEKCAAQLDLVRKMCGTSG